MSRNAAKKTSQAKPEPKASDKPQNQSSGQSGDTPEAKPPTSQNAEQSKEPSQADVKRASEPGGQPGATLPRPDRVEGMSSAMAQPMQGAGGDVDQFRANVAAQQREGSVVTGPNHDLPDPTPEHTVRMPAGTVVNPDSGPLEAPTDAEFQRYPETGYDLSSTDHTYAAVGGRTVAGESHLGLVDEEGNKVAVDSLFTDVEGKTYVETTKRVYEQFRYPNTVEVSKRLLFLPGQRVNRAEAERIKATM